MADTTGSYSSKTSYSSLQVHSSSDVSATVSVTTRSTSTVLDCPATTPANSPLGCTVTVSDTASGTKTPPTGTDLFSTRLQSTRLAATYTPFCLVPGTTSSSCNVDFMADTTGSYTIKASYSGSSLHTASDGSDTVSEIGRASCRERV